MRYLDEIGSGPSLVPATPAARAVMEQWISAINCYGYDALVRKYALRYVIPMGRGQEPDLAEIRGNVPAMERHVALLDAAYADRTWIAGDTISLADLLVAPIVQTVAMFPEGKVAVGKAANLSRAHENLQRRRSYTEVHANLFG